MANCFMLPIYFLVILYGVIDIQAATTSSRASPLGMKDGRMSMSSQSGQGSRSKSHKCANCRSTSQPIPMKLTTTSSRASPLGMKDGRIPVGDISATGITDPNVLNRLRYDCCTTETGTSSGLCLSANILPQKIQIQLRKPTHVHAITIQAPADLGPQLRFVKYYKIFYKLNAGDPLRQYGSLWEALPNGWKKENKVSLKDGNGTYPLMETLVIQIDDSSQFNALPCLRMEVFGCPEEECAVMWDKPTVDAIDDGTGGNQVEFRCHISKRDHRPGKVTHTATWIYNGKSIRTRFPDTTDKQIVSVLKQEDLYPDLPDSSNRNVPKGGIKCSVSACKTGECASWRSQALESNELTPTVKIDPDITTGNLLVLEEGKDAHDIKIRLNGPPVLFLHKDKIQATKGSSVLVQALFHLGTRTYPCSTTLPANRNYVIVEEKCGFEVTSVTWKNEHTVKLKAVMDGLYNESQIERKFDVIAYHLKEKDKTIHFDSIRFNPQPLKVLVKNSDGWELKIKGRRTGKTCTFVNDPHIITFDGTPYDVHLPGEFIVYRHKTLGYQVNSRFYMCGDGSVACLCGVAVKVGNAVVVIDICKKGKATHFTDVYIMENRPLPAGLRVYTTNAGTKHHIYLPSGTYVTVYTGSWDMYFSIVPSLGDRDQTEGLCGFYDGPSKDDLKDRNGNTFPPNDTIRPIHYRYNPFGEHWRDTSEPCGKPGIFYGVPVNSRTPPVRTYCNCVLGSDTHDCGEHKDAEPCLPQGVKIANLQSFDSLCTFNNGSSGKGERKKRAVAGYMPPEGEDDVYQSFVFNASYAPGPLTWPTASGWTEAKAKTFCENYLFQKDGVNICKTFLGTTFDTEIKNCIFDIQVSDKTDYAKAALMNIISQCTAEAQKYPATTTDLPNGIKKDVLYSSLCLDNCNNNGTCKDAACVCNTGFYGSVCSLTKDKPPIIVYLSRDGLCNIRTRNCTMSYVFGTGYIDSSDLKCRMTPYNHVTGVRDKDKRFESNATFINFNMITCPHNNQNGTYILAVSNNNGKAYSKEEPLFVAYDSACHDKCSIDQEARIVNCTQQTTGCAIGQKCYLSGEVDGENKCKICNTNISISDWSVNTAFSHCMNSTSFNWPSITVPVKEIAIIAGGLIAVLLIIMIVVAVVTHKYCRRR